MCLRERLHDACGREEMPGMARYPAHSTGTPRVSWGSMALPVGTVPTAGPPDQLRGAWGRLRACPGAAMGSGTVPLCPAFFDPGALEACGAPGATLAPLRHPAASLGHPGASLRLSRGPLPIGAPREALGRPWGAFGAWGHLGPAFPRFALPGASWGLPAGCLGTGLVGGGVARALGRSWGPAAGHLGRPEKACPAFFSCRKPAENCRFLPR